MKNDDFDTGADLKWRYFFDKNEQKLFKAFKEIEGNNYKLENCHENDDGDWVIQLSKIEIHTPDS
ncbi:MAG: hypothetical protein HOM14_09045 [Gammaproteobacteria bacterium]|jgi:hypothetical protein|nr:hypothetical protein [Gammaproteobacteria bacterium]MBT3721943.1 hypothetical protein [Gammaproteobacteria bacterium]MBT4075185.1 hypothetical protein [Gammaproteobacteria bacterium]MBT4192985.1 hypothetical protein [Gammaproteobacteria bacterium]MBT4450919.1 hypothetical protein [Gammaproteobacteria bacterium]